MKCSGAYRLHATVLAPDFSILAFLSLKGVQPREPNMASFRNTQGSRI